METQTVHATRFVHTTHTMSRLVELRYNYKTHLSVIIWSFKGVLSSAL